MSVFTGGSDPVGFNNYLAQINYDFSIKRPVYQISYVNNQFLPLITTKFTDGTVPYTWGNNFYYERQRSASALFSFVKNRLFYEYDQQVLSFGIKTLNLANISSLEGLSPCPNQGNLNSLIALWQYSNARTYPYSISYEDGVSMSAMLERATPIVASDYTYTNYSGSFNNYYPLPLNHHVLALSATGYYSSGDYINQSNVTWRYGKIRGYRPTLLSGNKLAVGSLEYRFPIAYPENGGMYGNIFFDRIWANLFYDEGVAGFTPLSQLSLKRGLGGELNFNITSLWGLADFIFTFRYEKGLDDGGINSLGLVFNLGSLNI